LSCCQGETKEHGRDVLDEPHDGELDVTEGPHDNGIADGAAWRHQSGEGGLMSFAPS